MGMFDSLSIDIDGYELQLQTKRFDNVLASYRLGDWVAGCMPGVRVYFYPLWLNDEGKQVYGAVQGGNRQKTVFVALVQGVFVDYQIHEGEIAAEAIETILHQLRERWSDSARVRDFLVETLRTQQQHLDALENRLNRIQSIIDDTRRLNAGETLDSKFGGLREEYKKLAAGEDPFEVIAWVLGNDIENSHSWGAGVRPNLLDEYRL